MIHLKPTDLIAVPVPPDCYDQEIITLGSTMANIILRWKEGKYKHHADTPDIFDDFIDLPENRGGYALLGTVTEKDIDFDPSVYLKKGGLGTYKDYTYISKGLDEVGMLDALLEMKFKTASESFYSLLNANKLLFLNPAGEKEPEITEPNIASQYYMCQLTENYTWTQYQKNLVKKLLILKPI